MKRTFLKVLPFAAALLLATSCSKDDNTSVDEIVNNGGEQIENVVKTFKTLTVKGKVNKSISKVTVVENALAFEGNEVFTLGSNTDDVYGTITFSGTEGDYTATINYTDETVLSGNFTATLGTNPATISAAYDNLAAAVKNAYYTIDFTITQNGGEYKLRSGDASDIVVNLQSAFIKALAGNTEKLGGEDITVEAGKYYIVPVGKTMGETSNQTVAGKIYTIKVPDYLPGVFTVAAGKTVKFSKGNLQYHCKNGTWRFAENQWDYIGSDNKNISSSYDGYIDLFGWGTWLEGGNPVNKSTTYSDYTWDDSKSSAFGSEWTTLTSVEWQYLFQTRTTTSNIRYAKAEVNGVNGVILLPDDWSSETYTLNNTNISTAAFTTNTIDATTWSTLEAAGAVFLPAAGYRRGESVYNAGSLGGYWSGTANGASLAFNVDFDSGLLYPAVNGYRYDGFSVRLVRVQN